MLWKKHHNAVWKFNLQSKIKKKAKEGKEGMKEENFVAAESTGMA